MLAPAKEQRLGQVERAEDRVVPAAPTLREIAAVAWNCHVEDGQAAHRLGMVRGQREGRGPAPVVADKKEIVHL